jgi:hypothetical protein
MAQREKAIELMPNQQQLALSAQMEAPCPSSYAAINI